MGSELISDKYQMKTAVFCLCLGVCGVYRVYVGKKMTGTVMASLRR